MRPSSSESFNAIAPTAKARDESGRGLLLERADELLHAIGLLGAEADPVFDACNIELQFRFALARDRVEITDLLQVRAALTLAAVGNDDVIEGLVGCAAPGEANSDHCCVMSCWEPLRGPRKKERGFYAND